MDCETMALRISIFEPVEMRLRAEEVLERLEARRDPIRLKEHLFWMIVPTRDAGELTRSVEIADRAIDLAARLGVEPVQYPTFKAWALLALGRFDDAWRSVEEEVASEAFRFGAALQRFGFFRLREAAGDVDGLFEEFESLLAEARALNRAWMVDGLAHSFLGAAARAGRGEEALARVERCGGDLQPRGLARAELALARGDHDEALAIAERGRDLLERNGKPLLARDASALAARALLAQRRLDEARAGIDEVVDWCAAHAYRELHWQALAVRAAVRAGSGDAAGAAADRRAGAAELATMAETISDPRLRRTFLDQPLAQELAGALE